MSSRRGRPFLGGGIDGNERLTAVAGVLLLVLFAVIGVTIIRIGQLLWLHLFLGLLAIVLLPDFGAWTAAGAHHHHG